MSNLRSGLIRLAHSKPEFRPAILPLLKEAGCEKLPEGGMRDNCEKKVEEGKKASSYLTEEQFRDNNHTRNMRYLNTALKALLTISRSVKSIYTSDEGAQPTREQSAEMLMTAQAIALNAGDIVKLVGRSSRTTRSRSFTASARQELLSKTAASEIPFSELPEPQMELVKIVDLSPVTIWDGVHGYIVSFKSSSQSGARLERDTLKKIVDHKDFRWISPSGRGSFYIGM
jgi:hypothetical protein